MKFQQEIDMKHRILIILGHPDKTSFCASLARAYKQGALNADTEVKEIFITDLKFNPNLFKGNEGERDIEEDILNAQELIKWAEHIVFVYPVWWGTYPALLKGFIDRVFLTDFWFKCGENSLWGDKLLAGKSAHLIVTMDSPSDYSGLVYGSPGHKAMKKMTLEFCGIKPVRISSIGSVQEACEAQRQKWLGKIERYGKRLK